MNRDDYTYGSRVQGGSFRNFSDREDQWPGGPWYGQGAYLPGGYGQGFQGGQQWSPGQYGFQGFHGGGYGQGGFGPGIYGAYGSPEREFGRVYEGQEGLVYGGGAYAEQQAIRQRGHFSGRGPKGYHRSDDRIREDVNEELTRHPDIDAFEIEVRVENGEVTLTGIVEDRHAKRLAEDLAERSSGVTDVHNQLRVRQGLREKISSLVSGESPEEQRTLRSSEREAGESRSRGGRSTT